MDTRLFAPLHLWAADVVVAGVVVVDVVDVVVVVVVASGFGRFLSK